MNLYSRIAAFFVGNRQFSLLLLYTIFIFGVFFFVVTPKQYNPEISLPAFRITTEFPGATPAEVESLVTAEVENKLYEIPGVDKSFSQSLPGRSVVTVLFKVGQNLDSAKTKVYEKMMSNVTLAPLGVSSPIITQVDPENVPIMTMAISSKVFDQEGLRQFAFDFKEKLKTVQGVTNIEVNGGRTKQLSVTLDPERMSARNISSDEVKQAIAANNFRTPVGAIKGESHEIPVEVDGNLDAKVLARIAIPDNRPLAPSEGGGIASAVYLEDIATVEEGYGAIESIVRMRDSVGAHRDAPNDAATVFLSLAKLKGENISVVSDGVEKRLTSLKTWIPDGITVSITQNEGETASHEVNMLTEHLFFSIAIVVLILMYFLGFRASMVVALAIPLTLALVFVAGYFADQTINRITLFALIFSLGLLVDDAIVVVENIYRHFSKREEGRTDAIIRATGEVGMGVLLSTITAVIVFVPMAFVSGMMGAYMGPIAFFAPVARLMSLFVAYSFSPYLASVFLREEDAHSEQHSTKIDVWYRNTILGVLENRKKQNKVIIGAVLLVVIAFSLPVVELVHFRMLPKADREQFYITIDAPDGTPMSKTDEFASRVEKRLLLDQNVLTVQSFIAIAPVLDFNGLFKGNDARVGSHQATIRVNLTKPSERSERSEEIVSRLRPELQKLLADEPDTRLKLVEDPPGPPVLSTLLARIKGEDDEMREEIARDLLAMMRKTKGVTDLDSTIPTGSTEKLIRIDHEKLASSGLSSAQVIDALSVALSGTPVSIAHLGQQERTNVVVRFQKSARDEVSDLSKVYLKNGIGQMVPLASVVKIEDAATPSAVWHQQREKMTYVGGEIDNRAVVYVVKELLFNLFDYTLPNGKGKLVDWNLFGLSFRDSETGHEYRIEWDGEFEMTLENFRDLGLAMLVSFFLIYVVLVAQFKSFRSPLLIMTTIPLGFAGVLAGFAILDLFGIYFTATSMIGIIALGGIVTGNAILLLDFIEQLKSRGYTAKMAIMEAAQTRLRPILLTSLTAVLGSLVIIADPVWSGLAWAIFFGLSLSTVLTLLVFPVLYFRVIGDTDFLCQNEAECMNR